MRLSQLVFVPICLVLQGRAMTVGNTVTLILQYNYGDPGDPSLGSVWAYNGDGSAGWEDARPLEDLPGFVKVVGPIDYEIAARVHAGLKRFFEESGETVLDKGITD
jgi:hypothetical protein